jgi:putative endopeptidase
MIQCVHKMIFFSYVNNKWLAANPIPKSESRWGTFVSLYHQSLQDMHEIFLDLVGKQLKPGSIEQIARDFYETGIHFDEYKDQHVAIIINYCRRINAIKNKAELWGMIGELQTVGIAHTLEITIDADDKDSSRHSLRLQQPRLTLPNRDYYLDKSKVMEKIRNQYQDHAQKVFAHFPIMAPDVDDFWKIIWEFEYGIAKISRSNADLRNVKNNYHRTSFSKLKLTYPDIDWEKFSKTIGWQTTSLISVDQPEYFKYLNQLVSNYTLEEWKTFLKWGFVVSYYGIINNQFARLKFEFFGKILGGAKTLLPLWKRVINRLDIFIGEGVGRLYVKEHFPASSKAQVLSMVEEIRQTYKKRLQGLGWMSQSSKQRAIKKLANIRVLIGYPDKWRDYQGLVITRESYLSNILSASKFQAAYSMDKLDQPVSRDEWMMCPQTVNAYNDPSRLVICFPAAILQAPFFNPKSHISINMGGIGTVICHELTHAFDDEGCQFDESGNVKPWQTTAERHAFAKRAQVIIKQADKFEVLPGLYMIGKLVIGESIADLGGLEIAYDALSHKLKNKLDQKITNDSTANQLFYINYAFTECAVNREARSRELILNNPHADERFRVNGILTHCDNFYKSFDLKPGDKLYLPANKRVKIW